MYKSISLFILIIVLGSCNKPKNTYKNDASSLDRLMVAKAEYEMNNPQRTFDTVPTYTSISKDYIVDSITSDTDALIVNKRSVVIAFYSESEIKKEFKINKDSEVEGELYNDIFYYTMTAREFLEDKQKEKVYIECEKKYLKFIMADSSSLIVDRHKAVKKIFLFNPKSKILQSDIWVFSIPNYKRF